MGPSELRLSCCPRWTRAPSKSQGQSAHDFQRNHRTHRCARLMWSPRIDERGTHLRHELWNAMKRISGRKWSLTFNAIKACFLGIDSSLSVQVNENARVIDCNGLKMIRVKIHEVTVQHATYGHISGLTRQKPELSSTRCYTRGCVNRLRSTDQYGLWRHQQARTHHSRSLLFWGIRMTCTSHYMVEEV
jgi:hypothetical protein